MALFAGAAVLFNIAMGERGSLWSGVTLLWAGKQSKESWIRMRGRNECDGGGVEEVGEVKRRRWKEMLAGGEVRD